MPVKIALACLQLSRSFDGCGGQGRGPGSRVFWRPPPSLPLPLPPSRLPACSSGHLGSASDAAHLSPLPTSLLPATWRTTPSLVLALILALFSNASRPQQIGPRTGPRKPSGHRTAAKSAPRQTGACGRSQTRASCGASADLYQRRVGAALLCSPRSTTAEPAKRCGSRATGPVTLRDPCCPLASPSPAPAPPTGQPTGPPQPPQPCLSLLRDHPHGHQRSPLEPHTTPAFLLLPPHSSLSSIFLQPWPTSGTSGLHSRSRRSWRGPVGLGSASCVASLNLSLSRPFALTIPPAFCRQGEWCTFKAADTCCGGASVEHHGLTALTLRVLAVICPNAPITGPSSLSFPLV